jgi:hypothetical protein
MKEDDMGWTCRAWWVRSAYKCWLENPKKRNQSQEVEADERIILK